jgi:hypothetical protein
MSWKKGETAHNKIDWETRVSKVCPKCKLDQPASEWYKYLTGPNAPRWSTYCKPCSVKLGDQMKGRSRNARLLRKYGVTADEYGHMLSVQNSACAVCGDVVDVASNGGLPAIEGHALVVDHNHKTGNVRGLLCRECNLGIGYFKDDPVRLQWAIKYLEGFD